MTSAASSVGLLGLDAMAAEWRLDSPVRTPAQMCPICGAPVVMYDTASDEGTCSCHRSLAISTEAAR